MAKNNNTENAGTDAQLGVSSENIPAIGDGKDARSDVSTDPETETTARQLMETHRVTAIWHSADGNWFTDKNAAMAHDAGSQCFTLETTEQ